MIKARRLLGIMAGLAMVGVVCLSHSQGEPQNTKTTKGGPVIRPVAPAEEVGEKESAGSRFENGGVITYQTLKGELLFALQLKPKLPSVPARKRDYLIIVCNAAAQAGAPWIASTQIADAIIQTAGADDRVSLWTLSTPEQTKSLTGGFLYAKDDRKKLTRALDELKNRYFPSGDSDLKTGLAKALASFDGAESRQRILLYLGDGQSIHNPIEAADRHALVQDMVKQHIAFFPVPMGLGKIKAENIHGLATGTGGAVLRTEINHEKLPDALKRYQEVFAGAVLYDAEIRMPASITQVLPQKLPPLRADTPTLVVGRLDKTPAISFTLSGAVAGLAGDIKLEITEKVGTPDLDNYFLSGLVNQWQKAAPQPALLRADRALALAFENTRLYHEELLLDAQMALEREKIPAALLLFERAHALAPHDQVANAGIKVCADLSDGKLTPKMIKAQFEKAGRVAEKVEKVNGIVRWTKANFVELAQPEKVNAAPANKAGGQDEGEAELKALRDRVTVEEQKMTQIVDTVLQQARKELPNDPDGALDLLRNTLTRIKDHPVIGAGTRRAMEERLETGLREVTNQGRAIKLQRDERIKNLAIVQKNQERQRERITIENRTEAQYRVYKELMGQARIDEFTKTEVLRGLEAMAVEARRQGRDVPLVSSAAYTQVAMASNAGRAREITRMKEQRFLQVVLAIDKSHIPFSDEPEIYFPPLKTWQAISDLRKEKYEVSSLPDDRKGFKEATSLNKLLEEPIETKDLQNPMKLKEALGLFYDLFQKKGKELPILIDKNAFKEENPDATEVDEIDVKFPSIPRSMSMATALRLALSQVPTNNATYLIRRNFIEVTTNDRMVREKVLRVYPVGDLVIPISQAGGQTSFNFGGGGQQGQGGGIGGVAGGLGGGALGGGLGGALGGLGGGLGGALGGALGLGGGIGLGGLGGLGGALGGALGLGGAGLGGGLVGQPVGTVGNFQGVGGSFNGGSFQGGFNGSLGALGATQAISLITTITRVVAPGEWFIVKQPNPFQASIFAPFGGGMGMFGALGGMLGNMGGNMMGMFGAGPPQTPVSEGGPADIQKANTIEFFPPALAIIVRGPSRIHTSITGGIIGGKQKPAEAVMLEAERRGLEIAGGPRASKVAGPPGGDKEGRGKNAPQLVKVDIKKAADDLDPTKVWNDALTKGGVDAGMVIATADFLFEAGQYQHAAEFLKANLRAGIVVKPWVYEALAVALEASGGDPDEIRRARLSAVSLDPSDAQGFLKAARALADHKQYDRALAFCRQAALLEPNSAQPFAEALAYAELGKDSKAMEWAVGKLLSQDWTSDNQALHSKAQLSGQALSQALFKEKRGTEANNLKQALQALRARDLVINVMWDLGNEPADLELEVTEPTGTVCSVQQKQSPGGGILIGTTLTDMTKASYMAAMAFSGEYQIKVRRLFGQPLQGRARLEIIQNAGTAKETRKMEIFKLDQPVLVKIDFKNGRRTELATVPPPSKKQSESKEEIRSNTANVLLKLRGMSFPDFSGAGTSRKTTASSSQSAPRLPADAYGSQATPITAGGGLNLTAQVKMSPDQREASWVLQPIFQTIVGNRPDMTLPLIPGAGPQR